MCCEMISCGVSASRCCDTTEKKEKKNKKNTASIGLLLRCWRRIDFSESFHFGQNHSESQSAHFPSCYFLPACLRDHPPSSPLLFFPLLSPAPSHWAPSTSCPKPWAAGAFPSSSLRLTLLHPNRRNLLGPHFYLFFSSPRSFGQSSPGCRSRGEWWKPNAGERSFLRRCGTDDGTLRALTQRNDPAPARKSSLKFRTRGRG